MQNLKSLKNSRGGSSIVELMVAVGILMVVTVGTNSFIISTMQQSGNVKRSLVRSRFEQQLVSLYSQSPICSCNFSGISIPDSGQVTVPGLRSACPISSNDIYQASGSGFSVDPVLAIESITLSTPLPTNGTTTYSARLNIKYQNSASGSIALKDGAYLLVFDTTSVASPYQITGCSLNAPAGTGSSSGWSITGNSGLNSTNFLGSTTDTDVIFKRNNFISGLISTYNTSEGVGALVNNVQNFGASQGLYNSAFGSSALSSNLTGNSNTAAGFESLKLNTSGSNNTAFGAQAASQSTNMDDLTALGALALYSNISGIANTAVGFSASQNPTTKSYNTSVGWKSLQNNGSMQGDTAIGAGSLQNETGWIASTAFGYNALNTNTSGSNSAIGSQAMANSATSNSVAAGANALQNDATGLTIAASTSGGASSGSLGAYFNTGFGANSLQSFAPTGGAGLSGEFLAAFGVNTLLSNTSGADNSAFGANALQLNTTAGQNTAFGANSLRNNLAVGNTAIGAHSMEQNLTGINNTAMGFQSLQSNTSGNKNTAVGLNALQANTTSSNNTAVGYQALLMQTTGAANTAVGRESLKNNISGSGNTAIGNFALLSNTVGTDNIAAGMSALSANISGTENTAFGYNAISTATTVNQETAFGKDALLSLQTGDLNAATGSGSLRSLTTGADNLAIGADAMRGSTALSSTSAVGASAGYGLLGANADTTGVNDTFIGANTGIVNPILNPTQSVAIGYGALVDGVNRISIGAPGVSVGIGVNSPGAYQLQLSTGNAVKPFGGFWSLPSDARLKDIGSPFTRGLASIENIHPVYYHYKKDNPLGLPSEPEIVGVLAQEAQKAVPESVNVDGKGYLHLTSDSIIWAMVNSIKEVYYHWISERDQIHTNLDLENLAREKLEIENTELVSENENLIALICQNDPSATFCSQKP